MKTLFQSQFIIGENNTIEKPYPRPTFRLTGEKEAEVMANFFPVEGETPEELIKKGFIMLTNLCFAAFAKDGEDYQSKMLEFLENFKK
jgi:hypothetical protein